jgi:hypothetical protein
MQLYEPLNVPKPVDDGIWIVDGPIVKMAFAAFKMPFPTRMVVVRLAGGGLFLWSPIELNDALRAEIDRLGPVQHLVSPNRIHYAHIAAWKAAYPSAIAWASPGVRERAAAQRIEVSFDRDLDDAPDAAWAEELDQLVFRGSRALEEVVFFHRRSRTLVLADLIENFEPSKVEAPLSWLLRLGGVADPDGKAPSDLRATFLGHRDEARASYERMLAWAPERVIMAHGRWYPDDGVAELRRAFRWLT